MRIGISIKWTLSAVLIVLIVIVVYAYFTTSDLQKTVERETDRIKRIQYDALDQIGSKTTLYISFPASNFIYDNDKAGLETLLSSVVENQDNLTSY